MPVSYGRSVTGRIKVQRGRFWVRIRVRVRVRVRIRVVDRDRD